jgi:hypothetical protein
VRRSHIPKERNSSPTLLRKTKNLTVDFDDPHTHYKHLEKSPVPNFIADLHVEVAASSEALKPLCSTETQDAISETTAF